MSQTSVESQPIGDAGDQADSGNHDVISRLAEGDLHFGRYSVLGTDKDRQGKLPSTAAEITDDKKGLGVVRSTHAIESSTSGEPRYLDKNMANVMRQGRIHVTTEDAVTPDSDVFVRFQGGNEGKFRSDADGGNAAQLSRAKWVNSVGAGKVAILEIDLRG